MRISPHSPVRRFRPRRPVAVFAQIAVLAMWFLVSTCAAEDPKLIDFGTDANGKPISWRQAKPANQDTAGTDTEIVKVDEKGRLHMTFHEGVDTIELTASSTDGFGSNAKQTPWIEWCWMDQTPGGRTPNIDMFAEDTRPGKLDNRVIVGSLWRWGVLAFIRATGEDLDVDEQTFDGIGERGNGNTHTIRVGKTADGAQWFNFDGQQMKSVYLKGVLERDHSVWNALILRVRGGAAGDEFVFTSLKMGSNFEAPEADAKTGAAADDDAGAPAPAADKAPEPAKTADAVKRPQPVPAPAETPAPPENRKAADAVGAPAPAAKAAPPSAKLESPAPPDETSVSAEPPAAVDTEASRDASVPVETSAPAKASPPAETSAPAETPAPPVKPTRQPLVFGTNAHRGPITWTLVQPADPSRGSAHVDDQGRLHLTFAPQGQGTPAAAIELRATDKHFFGAYENTTPWIEWSWIDDNIGKRTPNIDLFAQDTRPGKRENRVVGGSYLGGGIVGGIRVLGSGGGILEEGVAGKPGRKNGAGHTLRVGKEGDGTLWFIADGSPVASAFLKQELEEDHSAWNTLTIRVRDGGPGDDFVFTSLKMGELFEAPMPHDNTAAKAPPPAPLPNAWNQPKAAPPPPPPSDFSASRVIAFGAIFGVGVVLLLVFALRGR